MKSIKKLFSVLFLLILLGCNLPAYSNNEVIYTNFYKSLSASEWNNYFKKYDKELRKNWKKNKQIFANEKYSTSYAKVMFKINKNGEISLYDIKSSCIPSKDELFLEKVKQTIDKTSKLKPLPAKYLYDATVFSIKFYTILPAHTNYSNMTRKACGVSCSEIDTKGHKRLEFK